MNVVFDLGKVLVDWRPERAVAHLFGNEAEARAALDRIGFNAWNLEQDRGRSWSDGFAAAPDAEARRVFETYFENIDAAHELAIRENVELLDDLARAGVPLFALTNGAREATAACRKLHPFMAHFRDVTISAEHGVIKPEPAIYAIACQRGGYEPREAVFIDDSEKNVAGARDFGLHAIHYAPGRDLRGELSKLGVRP